MRDFIERSLAFLVTFFDRSFFVSSYDTYKTQAWLDTLRDRESNESPLDDKTQVQCGLRIGNSAIVALGTQITDATLTQTLMHQHAR